MTEDDARTLAGLQHDVEVAEDRWDAARTRRDGMIRGLRSTGKAGVTEMARVTGLGRRHVHKILEGG